MADEWKQSETGAWYKVAKPAQPPEDKKKKKKDTGILDAFKNLKKGYDDFLKTFGGVAKPAKTGK